MNIDDAGHYKPGAPRPAGYLQWHEWATVQDKAGLRQSRCKGCCKFLYPQERAGHSCLASGKKVVGGGG